MQACGGARQSPWSETGPASVSTLLCMRACRRCCSPVAEPQATSALWHCSLQVSVDHSCSTLVVGRTLVEEVRTGKQESVQALQRGGGLLDPEAAQGLLEEVGTLARCDVCDQNRTGHHQSNTLQLLLPYHWTCCLLVRTG